MESSLRTAFYVFLALKKVFNSTAHTADSFLASSLCGGTAENQNFGFLCVRARDVEPSWQGGACPDLPPVLRGILTRKGSLGLRAGRCKQRHSCCKQREEIRTATTQPPHSTQVTPQNISKQSLADSAQPALESCWWPCSAVTVTRDVAWRTAIDAGRLVPRASRIGSLRARSPCVEVEHSLLGTAVDEQPT